MKKKRPYFSLALAPRADYWRHDRSRMSRFVHFRGNTLETLIRRLNKVVERRNKPGFPWEFAFVYKNYPDYSKETECILTVHFKRCKP